jgi:hypothetical protein
MDTLMVPWIHLCHVRYNYAALDTLKSAWIYSCRPGYTYSLEAMSTKYNYVALDTLMHLDTLFRLEYI